MITYKIHTHMGSRNVNEDSVGEYMVDNRYCFVLADGLGGHGSGECASEAAVKTVLELFAENYNERFLDDCFVMAQEKVLEEQHIDKSKADMKTTLVTLVIDEDKVRWGHIGDSRLYQFNKGKVVQRTLDHSVPQMLVNLGEIKDKDIRGHEDRNRLLRVIGTPWNNHSYELSQEVSAQKCQAFLLCSDGFWELIDEKAMTTYLKKSHTVDEWMEFMVREVMKNGKDVNMDNNSAIAIWMED